MICADIGQRKSRKRPFASKRSRNSDFRIKSTIRGEIPPAIYAPPRAPNVSTVFPAKEPRKPQNVASASTVAAQSPFSALSVIAAALCGGDFNASSATIAL